MIRFGPAGIPLSCKGRTVRDGVLYTRALELDAMEVQFVRGIRMTEEDAEKVREAAEEVDVELHVKAPYYCNLAGDEKNVEMSFHKIVATGKLGDIMGAQTVVFHPGFYGELTKEETMKRVVENLREIRNTFIREGWTPRLGVEVMGKRNVFGSLDEVIELCNKVKGIVPVIDMAHIHARGNGILQDPEDYQAVFDRLETLGLDHYLVHFTGILYENGNARYRLPIKKGDLKFEPLCEVLLENKYNATILSTSPILEHDAMYMNIVFDRVKDRREARIAREIREAAEAAEKAAKEEEKRKEREEKERIKEEERRAKEEAEEAIRRAEEERLTQELREGKITQSDETGRRQVQTGPYRLYKKENRYYFMKEKKDGFSIVFKVPDEKEVHYSDNLVPSLRNKTKEQLEADAKAAEKAAAKEAKKAAKAPADAKAPAKPKPEPGTKPKVTQSDKTGRRQVSVDEYKLYKKDNRFYFMKEKKEGFSLIFKVPDDKIVVYGANGVPLLKAAPIPGAKCKVTQSDDSGRRQVSVDEYKLYKKDERFYFMKEKKDGFSLIFKVPDGKEVVYGQNGVPLVRAIKD